MVQPVYVVFLIMHKIITHVRYNKYILKKTIVLNLISKDIYIIVYFIIGTSDHMNTSLVILCKMKWVF